VVARPGGPRANVSVYPMPGTGAPVYQILDETYEISPPAINLGIAVSGNTITVTGQPASGEYLTIVADDAHVYSSGGTTTTALLQSLAAAAQANYPSAVATADTLTIPVGHLLIVRQGGVAVLGKVTRRQRDSIMVTVWAPNQVARSAIAKAVDNLIKQNIKVAMPDTSQALILYSRTITNDEQQAESIYRRDLIYTAEYATVEQFPGYVITSVQTSIANPSNTAIATAIT
jgi:hypothetical protein